MVTTCLIGTDTQVQVRPFWSDENLEGDFLAQLNGWADLTELILSPGNEALKIARYSYQDEIFTWIGLYRHAQAFNSSRKHNFIGAGILLRGSTANPTAALDYLVDMFGAFRKKYVRDDRQTVGLLDIDHASIAKPESTHALEDSIESHPETGGLTAAGKPRLSSGLVFIDGKDVNDALAARYLEWAQKGWQFQKYHTLIIGAQPTKMLMTKAKIVTPQEIEQWQPPAPPPRARAAPTRQRRQPALTREEKGPRFASREQSPALDAHTVEKDRYWLGVVSGIAAAICAGVIVWGLYIAQLWVTRAPTPETTANSTIIPAATETPASSNFPVASATSHDLNGALDATESFFKSLCTADRAKRAWSQATSPGNIAAFTDAHVPLCPLTVTVGTAQEMGVEDKGNGRVLIAEVELTATGDGPDRPWNSSGRIVLRTTLDSADRPKSWKVFSVVFDSPPRSG